MPNKCSNPNSQLDIDRWSFVGYWNSVIGHFKKKWLLLLAAALFATSCRVNTTRQVNTWPTSQPTTPPAGSMLAGFSFPSASKDRRQVEVDAMNAACVVCHTTDNHNMHTSSVRISCVDCHGGNWKLTIPNEIKPGDTDYTRLKLAAHVQPKLRDLWKSSANPEIPGAVTLQESADYIRFVNPGDLRAAQSACGDCHGEIVTKVEKSMMSHGGMLWEAALYNNGAINRKTPVYGESYTTDGQPRQIKQNSPSTQPGVLFSLWPLPRWEISQPGNILRVFERGAKFRPQVGVPETAEDPGKPDVKLSLRGFGTDTRTDPVFLGLQKTRLLDPTLNLFGTNDHPGDYRASGCTACHVVYANDSSPEHSGKWAAMGNRGTSSSIDATIPKDQPGHPIKHLFVKNMPTSTCIVCHIHPGTNVVNAYLGYTWWDNETEGKHMYPARQKYPTPEQEFEVSQHNPEGAAVRGLWSNLYPNDKDQTGRVAGPNFLENLAANLNPLLKQTQFADFHGHGWVFRAVYKQDRHGNWLDTDGKAISFDDPDKFKKAVHLQDIHLQKGMQCVDCHFEQDAHGNGNLYGETRNAVMIECIDCHGSTEQPAVMLQFFKTKDKSLLSKAFTGNAATTITDDQARKIIENRFEFNPGDGTISQISALDSNQKWTLKQAADGSQSKAALWAHTVRNDGKTWGTPPGADETKNAMPLAHPNSIMSCYACHSSWNTSCFGCHLPMRANQAKNMLHNEGQLTRNYTNYNFQTLRDDVYMLGKDSSAKGGKIVPIRSACAVLVSSQDANRQWIYTQQQTISAEGFSGQSFSPYFPHTVRTVETKHCTDCHVSSKDDNNAIMAQLLLQGTNAVNFIGRFAWVGEGEHGLQAVAVTERDEPQAVIGSRLHELAYPDFYQEHLVHEQRLTESHEHKGTILDLQLRGEYLYTACGPDGFIAYDVANIDNKGFSERIISAPVSPLGQKFYVKTEYATSICSPSTMAIDPTRPHLPENEEGFVHPMYAYLYVTDKYEGLVVIGNPLSDKRNKPGVATLLDGDPENNFLQKALSFNDRGRLAGARSMAIYGHYAFVCGTYGLQLVNLDDPLHPKLIDAPQLAGLKNPRKVAFQFRYGFVVDDEGMKVIDVTDVEHPRLVPNSTVPVPDARDIYLSRTYAYVAAGQQGLVIIDIEKPQSPAKVESFNAGGQISDATAVKIGMTNSCLYAYIADGRNGLKVLQLTSADERDDTPTYMGFSPRPRPRIIATFPTEGPAIAISEGLDRDRAVDESGNQLSVFGRKGARPLNAQEQRRLYLRDGQLFTVEDQPSTDPLKPPAVQPEPAPEPAPTPARRPVRR
ncbi:MAG TPA: hypothetical protein VHD56_13260 [Tepidisphaeraceae bacterium]|nr:hypothetical protein [Tepidisphaeraceae bacterium]